MFPKRSLLCFELANVHVILHVTAISLVWEQRPSEQARKTRLRVEPLSLKLKYVGKAI